MTTGMHFRTLLPPSLSYSLKKSQIIIKQAVMKKNLITQPIVSFYHFLWALGSALWFGFPSHKITVIGVTGTKGKTTVTELLGKILEASGAKVAIANGLHFKIADREKPNLLKMTMPGRGKLQKFLAEAAAAGCRYAIIEVTSEGIKQHRHRFIKFSVAAITNLRPEHLEAHGSFEAYREAKAELFRATRLVHVVNADDAATQYFRQFPARQKVSYSKKDFSQFRLIQPRSLPGEFNLYNILCAAAVAKALGISQETIRQAVAEFPGVPGRMEFIQREPFAIIVDYAHTPDSLEAVYEAIRYTLHATRLICVLGSAGGGRDKWKRPVMGEIASRYCDKIFLTNEDPYDEEPTLILSEIRSGVPRDRLSRVELIADRKLAIRRAVEAAAKGDAVIITGKGSEKFMALAGGKKIPWDERAVVREILENLN